MSPLRKKFYFLAPTTDSPVNGPIFLGGILTHPKDADMPLNIIPLPIDSTLMPIYNVEADAQSFTFEKNRSFTSGIWASFLAMILGISGDLESNISNQNTEKWTIKKLKTISFNPTPEYIKQSLEHSAVKKFITEDANWLQSSQVYMITGLKLAYGAESIATYAKSKGLNLSLGLDATSLGVPVQGGPKFGTTSDVRVEQSAGEKTPLVLAYRIRKIIVSSSGGFKDKAVDGGMLGIPKEVTEREGPDFIVQGLKEDDTDAEEFEIERTWKIEEGHGETTEVFDCSLTQD
jgi:hypothetical protein